MVPLPFCGEGMRLAVAAKALRIVSDGSPEAQRALRWLREHGLVAACSALPGLPPPSGEPTAEAEVATPSAVAVASADRVCVGGTFDHLHPGHKVLLTAVALWARKSIVCGVTGKGGLIARGPRAPAGGFAHALAGAPRTDEHSDAPLLQRKTHGTLLEPLQCRSEVPVLFLLGAGVERCAPQRPPAGCCSMDAIRRFLALVRGDVTVEVRDPPTHTHSLSLSYSDSRGNESDVVEAGWRESGRYPDGAHMGLQLVPLQDPFGPTVVDNTMTSLVVSQETEAGAHASGCRVLAALSLACGGSWVNVVGSVSQQGPSGTRHGTVGGACRPCAAVGQSAFAFAWLAP